MEHNHLEISDFWRLVDELTIVQAALLVIGLDPALYQDEIEEQGYSTAHKPKGYEAAKLAAYYSKARTSSQVPVDYAPRKNVKKPNGAKPGMVIYDDYGTVYVTPDEELVYRLMKNR